MCRSDQACIYVEGHDVLVFRSFDDAKKGLEVDAPDERIEVFDRRGSCYRAIIRNNEISHFEEVPVSEKDINHVIESVTAYLQVTSPATVPPKDLVRLISSVIDTTAP